MKNIYNGTRHKQLLIGTRNKSLVEGVGIEHVQHGVKEIYNCGTVTIIDDRLAIGYTAAS
jgi:hypothetical protein